MTEASDTPRENDVDHDEVYEDMAPESEPEPVIEPTDEGDAATHPEPEDDPVTRRNPDPAAQSEHERNARLAQEYGQPPAV